MSQTSLLPRSPTLEAQKEDSYAGSIERLKASFSNFIEASASDDAVEKELEEKLRSGAVSTMLKDVLRDYRRCKANSARLLQDSIVHCWTFTEDKEGTATRSKVHQRAGPAILKGDTRQN